MNPIKERPILFQDAMVRGILADQKTNTRRIINPQPRVVHGFSGPWLRTNPIFRNGKPGLLCPYGQPGDRLWVRETWQAVKPHGSIGEVLAKPSDPEARIIYRSTEDEYCPPMRWRPSIFMPRSACRILLEVTEVRVQRLNDITEADALAEGIRKVRVGRYQQAYEWSPSENCEDTAVLAFRQLWNSINGPQSWDQNFWVWAITFRRIR